MVIGEFTCGSGRRSGSWSPPPPSSCNSSPAASSMESWRQRASPNPKSGPRSTGTAGADQEAPHWQRSVFVWQGGFHSFHVTTEKNNWLGGSQTEGTAAVNSYRFGDAIWNCQSSIPIPIVYWALFRWPQNSKFFHSLSITLIFGHMHRALNIGKKITNYTVWL